MCGERKRTKIGDIKREEKKKRKKISVESHFARQAYITRTYNCTHTHIHTRTHARVETNRIETTVLRNI